jgi:hypothetical protein
MAEQVFVVGVVLLALAGFSLAAVKDWWAR